MQAVRLSVGLYRAFSRTASVSTSQSATKGGTRNSIKSDSDSPTVSNTAFSLPRHMNGPLSEY